MRKTIFAVLSALVSMAGPPAMAADVLLLTAGAFKPIAVALAPRFEAATGDRLVIENDTAGALLRRIRGSSPFHVAVITPAAIDELAKDGRIVPDSKLELARVRIGVAVKAGTPPPDLSSVEAFKQAVLAATRVAYIDPQAGGSSGIYLARLFERLGIAEAVKAKAVLVPGGLVAEKLVTGEADLAIHQISEILAVPGAVLAGPLPAEIQNETIYAAGMAASTAQAEKAQAVLRLLAGPEAAAILKDKGMLPPGGK